jgi:hypothetical protein
MPENAAWAMVKPAGLKYPHKSFYPFPAKKRPASTTFGGDSFDFRHSNRRHYSVLSSATDTNEFRNITKGDKSY